MRNKKIVIPVIVLCIVVAGELILTLFDVLGREEELTGTFSSIFLLLIGVHLLWGIALLRTGGTPFLTLFYRVPEILFIFSLILFLFSYIYASNANMDYVQRFAESGGNIWLAPDSSIERLHSLARFLPFLSINAFFIIFSRLQGRLTSRAILESDRFFGRWGLFLSLLSAFLYTIALPSFLSSRGLFPVGFVCLVPFFLAVRFSPYRWAVFYGISFGVVQTMLCNFWLGTFSLISLQFITVLYLLLYSIFMLFALWIVKRSPDLMFISFPALWVVFDYLRTQGFMGYPWAFLGSSQYSFLPLIQISALIGVWGVTFVLVLSNTAITEVIISLSSKRSIRPIPVVLFVGVFVFSILFGEVSIAVETNRPPKTTARIALIQQNTDPRKHDYRESLDKLKRLTNAAMKASSGTAEPDAHAGTPDFTAGGPGKPDLIAWSETAFVPNIRRWGAMEPWEHSYAGLVHDLRAYQRGLNTWLVTGNDDYTLIETEEGEERLDYNASILFSPEGERISTYHKLHLVPFTEYFPYKDRFPRFYNLLLDFDVNLWEPGTELHVFEHPKFSFCTPICFEDSFPADIRAFIRAGSDVILNLSNDFWSLTEAEAGQHFANSLFRAVENRRPLLRSTASGVTAYVDTAGRVHAELPLYVEGYLVVDVSIPKSRTTLYTWLGDWFPIAMMVLLLVLPVGYYYVFVRDEELK